MRADFRKEPRVFEVKGHAVKDWGKIFLEDGEMVSFRTPGGRECDFAAKSWGFYLGPSLNSRLKKEGFKVALTMNERGQLYVLAVEAGKMGRFRRYLKANQDIKVLTWLDDWLTEDVR